MTCISISFSGVPMGMVRKRLAMAQKGDLDGLKAMKLTPSPKVQAYHAELVGNLAEQLNPPPAPKKIGGAYKQFVSAVPVTTKASAKAEGLEKLGAYAITADAIGVPAGTPTKGTWKKTAGENTALWKKGEKAHQKLSYKQRQAVEDYTGHSYDFINAQLRFESKPHSQALDAANGVHKAAIPLPQGQMLSRKHNMSSSGGVAAVAAKLKPGMVIAEPGIMSASTSPEVWSGNIHLKMTVGPGVKGLPARSFSHHDSENEVLLPPNTRMLVTKVLGSGSSVVTVEATILPHEEGQCCPP